jgi:hypothetical protein
MIKFVSQDYPVEVVCDVLGLARSTYYEDPKIKEGDIELKEAMEKIIMKRPYYGYRRILHEMKRKRAMLLAKHGLDVCSMSWSIAAAWGKCLFQQRIVITACLDIQI